MKRYVFSFILITAVMLMIGCSTVPNNSPSGEPVPTQQMPDISGGEETHTMTMTATSSGIKDGVIDPMYGMHGETTAGVPVLSLPITIENAPAGTACYAVFMDDPDARGFIHWMAANIPVSDIPADYSRSAADDIIQGINDFDTDGYGGPAPPRDHTYRVVVYALDAPVDLQNGFTKSDFDKALAGHTLAEHSFAGLYVK